MEYKELDSEKMLIPEELDLVNECVTSVIAFLDEEANSKLKHLTITKSVENVKRIIAISTAINFQLICRFFEWEKHVHYSNLTPEKAKEITLNFKNCVFKKISESAEAGPDTDTTDE